MKTSRLDRNVRPKHRRSLLLRQSLIQQHHMNRIIQRTANWMTRKSKGLKISNFSQNTKLYCEYCVISDLIDDL
ncbi:hypothetical protein Q1695_001249 [Nippostrongylus brasiliensis]|nr:hypothetical protein Q1695_001249 [Nippostrongylus brasiliensis]